MCRWDVVGTNTEQLTFVEIRSVLTRDRAHMHSSRLFALVGIGIAVIGLPLRSLSTGGAGLLPTLSQMDADLPDGISSIWGGFPTWAQVSLVILIGAVVALTARPIHDEPLDHRTGSIVAVIGVVMLGYGVSEWIQAIDRANLLEAGFLEAARAGVISTVYPVSTSPGFVIFLVGAVLVVFGGVLGLREDRRSLY